MYVGDPSRIVWRRPVSRNTRIVHRRDVNLDQGIKYGDQNRGYLR